MDQCHQYSVYKLIKKHIQTYNGLVLLLTPLHKSTYYAYYIFMVTIQYSQPCSVQNDFQ